MAQANEAPASARRISSIFMIIIFVMLILSATALYQVVDTYRSGKLDVTSIVLSMSAIGISLYMLLQLRMKPLKLGFEIQKMLTTIQCKKCGYTNTRDFQQGDFIFKTTEPCPKCNELTMISSMYRKPEEKKKKKSALG